MPKISMFAEALSLNVEYGSPRIAAGNLNLGEITIRINAGKDV